MSSQNSIRSASSTSSVQSQISVMSEDSYRYSNNLTEAIDKIFEEQGIFTIRKKVSHHTKKLDPSTAPSVNVAFENGSRKMNDDYAAYKAEVAKIPALRKSYQKASKEAFTSCDPALHQAAINAAKVWCSQATNAGKLRIEFLQVHKDELKTHLCIKSTTDHIKQGQSNLNSANKATERVLEHEKGAIMKLAMKAAAENQ